MIVITVNFHVQQFFDKIKLFIYLFIFFTFIFYCFRLFSFDSPLERQNPLNEKYFSTNIFQHTLFYLLITI